MSVQSTGRTLTGWQDPVLIRRRGRSVAHVVATWFIVALLAILEAGVLEPLMEVVLGMGTAESWVVAGVIAIVGAVAMHIAGRIAAGVGPHRAGDGRVRVIALVGAWLLLGAALAVLRVVGMATSTNVTTIGQAHASSGAPSVKDLVAAGLFFVLFLIAGLIAFGQGMDRNDVHEALVLAEQARDGNDDTRTFWEGQLTRTAREYERRRADEARIEAWAAAERDLSAQVRDAAYGQVRTEIGRLKTDPAVIGIASPRHPDHPGQGVGAHDDGQ